MLDAFFAIPQSQIDTDIAEADKLPGSVLKSRLRAIDSDWSVKMLDLTVRQHHEYMVLIKAAQARPRLPKAFWAFLVVTGAARAVKAFVKGSSHQVDDFACLLTDDEKRMGRKEAAFLRVLRRYRLDGLANLYETNQSEFERLVKEGERINDEALAEKRA